MNRVACINGVISKAEDAPALHARYERHFGADIQAWGGGGFRSTDAKGTPVAGTTAGASDR